MVRTMAALFTGGCDPPFELLVLKLCREYNYTPPMVRTQSMAQIARELDVLEAEARVAKAKGG